ncbi:ABC transporter substrate-binding protein [Myceligenerans salitolerans]|uniref:Extracellular solute-binding protein n=1 Tax=Myceligenerans salitolerans TaxID=1230528 RepID=A0ABS3I7K6_9MICO|nr:extracellular solute-binding protein [Myceligenerans salitolerans]MBO0608982.1 extracellular solute-binding protein [Myceligenerans salitolerans]
MRTSINQRGRRGAAVAAGAAATALILSACGGGDSGVGGTGEVEAQDCPCEIRFSWWGSDERHAATQEIIDAFEAENPDITVVPDFTDWDGYWNKLSTTVAAGDTPDVMTQEERYVSDYATRGVLADLGELDIDTSKIDESILAGGRIDGTQYALPTGINAYAIVANPGVFEEAGVEIPDDTSWTWEEYVEVANAVSEGAGEGVWGAQDYGFNEAGLNILARQKGESLWTPDGEIGVSEETVAQFFQTSLDLMADGGQPDASRTIEYQHAGPEGSLVGTNVGGMASFWSNQLGALSEASGEDIQLLRYPGETEFERTGMYYKPAMFYSVSATTEYPDAAAKFVDFLLNSEEAAKINLTDRGLPANTDMREVIADDLTDADKQVADFMADLGDEIVDASPVPPNGSAEMQDIMERINTEVVFERITPEEAATMFMEEVNAAIAD